MTAVHLNCNLNAVVVWSWRGGVRVRMCVQTSTETVHHCPTVAHTSCTENQPQTKHNREKPPGAADDPNYQPHQGHPLILLATLLAAIAGVSVCVWGGIGFWMDVCGWWVSDDGTHTWPFIYGASDRTIPPPHHIMQVLSGAWMTFLVAKASDIIK